MVVFQMLRAALKLAGGRTKCAFWRGQDAGQRSAVRKSARRLRLTELSSTTPRASEGGQRINRARPRPASPYSNRVLGPLSHHATIIITTTTINPATRSLGSLVQQNFFYSCAFFSCRCRSCIHHDRRFCGKTDLANCRYLGGLCIWEQRHLSTAVGRIRSDRGRENCTMQTGNMGLGVRFRGRGKWSPPS